MNLYKIEQSANTGYDTYDSAIVAAENETEARYTDPGGCLFWHAEKGWARPDGNHSYAMAGTWTTPDNVTATLIGKAVEGTPRGVILASFNAG
jgi:hypothetical protein